MRTLPCLIHTLTGLYCPGCGITHMVTDILNAQFVRAARENLAVCVFAPIWIFFIVKNRLRRRGMFIKSEQFVPLAWVTVIGFALFGILRNLPGLEFLLPYYVTHP